MGNNREDLYGLIELRDKDILFVDTNYLAVNKPPGSPVHATRDPNRDHLEAAASRWLTTKTGGSDDDGHLRVAHRLDVWTSGVVLLARNRSASRALTTLFEEREVVKVYEAICVGHPSESNGELKHYLSKERESGRDVMRSVRSGGKVAITRYRIVGSDDHQSLVELRPLTGRTHQLRVQAADAGWPVLGDSLYGTAHPDLPGQMLHARRLTFKDPLSGDDLRIEATAPDEFRFRAEPLR